MDKIFETAVNIANAKKVTEIEHKIQSLSKALKLLKLERDKLKNPEKELAYQIENHKLLLEKFINEHELLPIIQTYKRITLSYTDKGLQISITPKKQPTAENSNKESELSDNV